MRKINYIVVHCSATREGCTLTSEVLEAEHRVASARRAITTISGETVLCSEPVPWNCPVRIAAVTTSIR